MSQNKTTQDNTRHDNTTQDNTQHKKGQDSHKAITRLDWRRQDKTWQCNMAQHKTTTDKARQHKTH